MPPLRHPSPAPWRAPDHVVVETCVENIDGVRVSAQAGADRAELCDNVAVGGTTPSIGVVEAAIIAAAEVKAERRARAGAHWADTPEAEPFGLRVMVRPRGGSYVFDADEGRAMIADVRRIASLAAQLAEHTRPQATGVVGRTLPPAVELGFVTGALTEDGELDRGLVRLLVDMGDGAPVTLNRAIDHAADLERAYRSAARLGLTHVLTDDVRGRRGHRPGPAHGPGAPGGPGGRAGAPGHCRGRRTAPDHGGTGRGQRRARAAPVLSGTGGRPTRTAPHGAGPGACRRRGRPGPPPA